LLDENGNLPRAGRALMADAVGTVAGSLLGTSNVTSFIESAAGVNEGGRTGLSSVFTAGCFMIAIFFYPIVRAIGGGYAVGNELFHPVTAPALVIVGSLMVKSIAKINWDDISETVPAYLTFIGIPLTYSITDGMSFGFISYPIMKLFRGKAKEIHPIMWVLFAVFVFRFVAKAVID
jgi:AGZA family xanthine/uracil permease-like MFS transporter